MLTAPDGLRLADCPHAGHPTAAGSTAEHPRLTSGQRLTPAFGLQLSKRRTPPDLPAIGTPEHTALMSGSLDLAELADLPDLPDLPDFAAGLRRAPLVGFAPIVLDPAGPTAADLAAVDDVRPGAGTPGVASASCAPLPTPRDGVAAGRPLPPVVAGPPTGALCIDQVSETLAAIAVLPTTDDPTPTGELARPFVTENCCADWVTVEDVPPPVSVDVFQRAVRARLAPEPVVDVLTVHGVSPGGSDVPEQAANLDAAASETAARARTRREARARERALGSVRSMTARRLAKGGVLAITALGVVSSANPHTLGAIGLDRDAAAGREALDFASALAPKITVPQLSAEGRARQQELVRNRVLRQEMADAAADAATHASTSAGSAVLDLAFQQDAVAEVRRRAELARAARVAARDPQTFAARLVADRGWSSTQFECLNQLWHRESHWNYRAVNRSSGAYGIAQANPGHKMGVFGSDWRTNPITQIKWGLNYIEQRYDTPCAAWAHSRATGWY